MLIPAVTVVDADTTVADAKRALGCYADSARIVVRRRVDRFVFWYVIQAGELSRQLQDAKDGDTLGSVVSLERLKSANTFEGDDAPAGFDGVVIRGDRVVGIAESEGEEEDSDLGFGATAVEAELDDFAEEGEGAEPDPLIDRGFRSREEVPAEGKNGDVVPVYFATDRKSEGEWKGRKLFGGERGGLQFGVADVSIPRAHERGVIERPPWWRPWENPEKHVVVLTVKTLERPEFTKAARKGVKESETKEVLMFVHGYNVDFPAALHRTAQLAHDLFFRGERDGIAGAGPYRAVPFLYSWPSQGATLDYMTDETNARWTVEHFEQVLRLALSEIGATTVHVIAHSMGNRVLIEALRTFDATALPAGSARLREVILAAPDFDADTFRTFIKRFHQRAENFTLYASSNDKALKLSQKLRSGLRRAGESGADLVVVEGLDTIDASDVMHGDFLDHSYFGGKTVLSDLFYLLCQDLDPVDRHLRQAEKAGLPYWRFAKG